MRAVKDSAHFCASSDVDEVNLILASIIVNEILTDEANNHSANGEREKNTITGELGRKESEKT
jgi:hypothetical protein